MNPSVDTGAVDMTPSVGTGGVDNIGPTASFVDLADIDHVVDSDSVATYVFAAVVSCYCYVFCFHSRTLTFFHPRPQAFFHSRTQTFLYSRVPSAVEEEP